VSELLEDLQEAVFRGQKVPAYMHEGIVMYVEKGVLPGAFLQAVICNDLKAACMNADDTNIELLLAYVCFFYNFTPSPCWGSKEKMEAWHTRLMEEVVERGETA
jgi:hypothetical protein